jgi:transcriptional regulator with XRE-family HTH domain
MTIEAQESAINGELIRLTRESRGWALGDLATRSCMSIRQIRQLEEGGTSSFYSLGVKVTAAKRVATLLGLSPEQVFASPEIEVHAGPQFASVPSVSAPVTAQPDAPLVLVSQNVMVSQAESDALTGVSLHVDETAHPSVESSLDIKSSAPSLQSEPTGEAAAELSAPTAPASVSQSEAPADKPRVSFVAVLFLFAAAIGVAALMRPEVEPPALLEASPPVLAVPDAVQSDPSSASASAPVAPADSASAAASSALIKPALVGASAAAAVNASAAAVVPALTRVGASSESNASSAQPGASGPRAAVTASAAAAPASGTSSKAP